MKYIKIKAADPMPQHGTQPEPTIIEIAGKVSEDTRKFKNLKQVEEFFESEADLLFKSLIGALPQGVIEPLTIKLLQRRVSLYHGVMK